MSIATGNVPQANPRDICKRDGSSAKPDAAVDPAYPYDANLANPEPCAPREKQQLDIEGKSFNREMREQCACRVRAEQLETALGVLDARQHEDLDERVEDPPDQVPCQRLADPARSRCLPRPRNHLCGRSFFGSIEKHRPVVRRD